MALTAEQEALNFNPELQDVGRQRKLAELLMVQGMQQPQGQMVSGHYVAPSFLQKLNPIANIFAGQAVSNRADKEQLDLVKKLREVQSTEADDLLKISREQGKEAAYAAALRGQTPVSQRMAAVFEKALTREPNWKETEVNVNGMKVKGLYDANTGDVASTFRPYSQEINVPLKAAQYEGKIGANEGGGMPFGSFAGMFNQPTRTPQAIPSTMPMAAPTQPMPSAPMTAPVQTAPQAQPPQNVVPPVVRPSSPKIDTSWDDNTPIPSLNAQPKPVVAPQTPVAPIAPVNPRKYDLEIPKSFPTPQKRDEWLANAQQPLTGEAKSKADGAVTTLNALDNYKELIDKYSKEQFLSPNARTELNTAHSQLMLQLKDANGLGVLNKGDLPILEKLIVNPNNMQSLLLSKKVLDNQITGQKEYIKNVVANAYLNSYKEIPPRIKQTLFNVDRQIELAKSQTQKQGQNGIPAGIPRELWNVMTPEEKAAFK
jgi:hypothetical protein